MSGIFISYRRDDTSGYAGALMRELNKRFGSENVFMDIEDIQGGQDFVRTLEKALDGCDVLIALIGPHWLDATDPQGRRRLEDASDYLRVEIATALQRDVWVIPVLTEGTAMPGADRLPDDLLALSSRNAMWISNTSWDESVDRLADQIRTAIYSPERARRAGRPLPPASFDPGRLMGGKMARFTAVALFLGLVSLGVGVYEALDTRRLLSLAHKAQGRVIENVRDDKDYYYPVLEFETEAGQSITFRSHFGLNPAAYQVGETATVLYNPSQPHDASIDSFASLWGLAIFLSLGGGSLGAVGIGMILFAVGRRGRWRRLVRNGRPIMTEFHSVEVNTHIKINERHPYRVVTKWRNPISDEIVYFHSRDVWDDPTEHVRYRSITVVVDPDNLSRYVMDESILPQQAKRSG